MSALSASGRGLGDEKVGCGHNSSSSWVCSYDAVGGMRDQEGKYADPFVKMLKPNDQVVIDQGDQYVLGRVIEILSGNRFKREYIDNPKYGGTGYIPEAIHLEDACQQGIKIANAPDACQGKPGGNMEPPQTFTPDKTTVIGPGDNVFVWFENKWHKAEFRDFSDKSYTAFVKNYGEVTVPKDLLLKPTEAAQLDLMRYRSYAEHIISCREGIVSSLNV